MIPLPITHFRANHQALDRAYRIALRDLLSNVHPF